MSSNNFILPSDEQEMTVSSIKARSPEQAKSSNSGLLEGTQRILYQGDPTDGGDESSDDGFHIDNDDSGPGLGGSDEETDSAEGDVDEHDESGPSIVQQISPNKFNTELKKPLNLHPSHRRNLSDVLETGMSDGNVSIDQNFLSPDLIAMKYQRQNAGAATKGLSAGKMPSFRQPLGGKKQTPTFSLQLMSAVQELKENEANPESDEDSMEESSVVNRRQYGQTVVGNVDEQLRKLIALQQQKQNLLDDNVTNPTDTISNYQEDSSQLQSFANSPNVLRHANNEQQPSQPEYAATSPLKNISPVKAENENLVLSNSRQRSPLKNFTPQKEKSAQRTKIGIFGSEDNDSDEGEIKFEMYSPTEDEPMQRVSFGIRSTRMTFESEPKGRGSFLDGMKDYLVKKKLNFDNMVTKLNEVEERLKNQQDIIDKRTDEEVKKATVRSQLEDQMAEASYLVTEVDRDGHLSKSSGGGNHTATTREDSGEEDLSTFSMTAKQEAQRRKIKRRRQMVQFKQSNMIEEVTFDSRDAELKNPKLFNSCINKLDEVDLAEVDKNQIDAEYFALKKIIHQTTGGEISETTSVHSFDVIDSPDKKQRQQVQQSPPQMAKATKKKKKFVKRLVPRPSGKQKKQMEQGSSETHKMKQMISDIFSVDGFKFF